MFDDAYRPVDLSSFANTGVAVLGAAEPPPVGGVHLFRGLPFLIGAADRALVLFDGRPESVTVPVRARANTIIFAHRLLGSRLEQGAPPGDTIATYTFQLADGTEHSVPIRERFEIGE